MTSPAPAWSARDRVLVLAPHPDDETLAAGELMQAALGAGATLRIVFATDGDNNPWPQRWLEKRWRIGAAARAHWGERRRREAQAALAVLGVDASAARFLGWPDQGLTERLMRDDAALAALTDEIAAFAPTHVVLPRLADRHPDHSALRVMGELALLRASSRAQLLGYLVHGAERAAPVHAADVPQRRRRKREAMLAHESQIALSRRRLLELAAQPERFEVVESVGGECPPPAELRLAHRAGALQHDLLLIAATPGETVRFRVRLPRLRMGARSIRVADPHGRELSLAVEADALRVALPALAPAPVAVYAKVHRVGRRLVVFDREPWHRAGVALPLPLTAVAPRAAAGLV